MTANEVDRLVKLLNARSDYIALVQVGEGLWGQIARVEYSEHVPHYTAHLFNRRVGQNTVPLDDVAATDLHISRGSIAGMLCL